MGFKWGLNRVWLGFDYVKLGLNGVQIGFKLGLVKFKFWFEWVLIRFELGLNGSNWV